MIDETEPKIGIFSDVSNVDYHADKETYSSSTVRRMDVPARARYYLDNPVEYKEPYRIGSAIHKYVLEREQFDFEFSTGLDCPRRSKADKHAWTEWFCAHGADGDRITTHPAAKWNELYKRETGLHIVTPEEIKMIADMAALIMADNDARALLENGQAEQSIYWIDDETGLSLRCRPDFLSAVTTDLKSCTDASEWPVRNEIKRRKYHVQAAMYADGVYQVTGEYRPFVLLFIEKTPPYLCAVYRIDDKSAEQGWDLYRQYLRTLAECLKTDTWPGIPNNLALDLYLS